MYSDNFWHLATAGRVYPKAKPSPLAVERGIFEAKPDPLAAWKRNRAVHIALTVPERLVKPAAYKALNESNGSGPSGSRG